MLHCNGATSDGARRLIMTCYCSRSLIEFVQKAEAGASGQGGAGAAGAAKGRGAGKDRKRKRG